MLIDAALISKKSSLLDYNTDGVNASGKIWPREIVHSDNGIRAAGSIQGKPYYVLADAKSKGTAESAADLFKSCVSEFAADGSNYSEKIGGFFRAFAQVLGKSGYDSEACNLGIFAGYEHRIYCAKSGKTRIFRFADGDFFEVKPQLFPHEDGLSSYGVSVYNNVKPGEIYIYITGQVYNFLSESLLKAIIKNADGDIKKIVAMIVSNAVKNGCTEAVSAIVLKVGSSDANVRGTAASAAAATAPALHEVELPEAENTPEINEPEETRRSSPVQGNSEYYEPTEDDIDDETEHTEKINRYKSRNKFSRAAIIDVVIVLVVVAVVLGILLSKGVIGKRKEGSATKEGVNISDIFNETTTKKTDKTSTTTDPSKQTTENISAVSESAGATTGRSAGATTARGVTPVQPRTTQPPETEAPATTPRPTETPVTEPPATDPTETEPPATVPTQTEPPKTDPYDDPNVFNGD